MENRQKDSEKKKPPGGSRTQPSLSADGHPSSSEGDKPSSARRSGQSCPPYNPELQRLVEAKQAWAEPLDEQAQEQGFLGWHQGGYLPHRDAPGLVQLVTLRLVDSFPASRRSEWEALRRIENNRRRRIQLEEYLDRGHGECWLRQPAVAAVADGALRHFNGQRYDLLAWTVMPNHLHVLVQIRQIPLASLLQGWKSFIAVEANKRLHRHGTFWQEDYWDTYMRSEEQMLKARRDVERNPVKARFVREVKDWPWSSARFRDQMGRLVIPS